MGLFVHHQYIRCNNFKVLKNFKYSLELCSYTHEYIEFIMAFDINS